MEAVHILDELAPHLLDSATTDIGEHGDAASALEDVEHSVLRSQRKEVLRSIHHCVGGRQVNDKELSFAPPWIMEQAFEKELTDNSIGAFEEVGEHTTPPNKMRSGATRCTRARRKTTAD